MSERLLTGWIGELKVVKRLGVRIYKWAGQDIAVSVYLLQCKKLHQDIRSAASLRETGEHTKCKTCRARVRKSLIQPPKKRGK